MADLDLNRAIRSDPFWNKATGIPSVDVRVQDGEARHLIIQAEQAIQGHKLSLFLRSFAVGHFQTDTVERFAFEGDRKSGNWPPLKKATRDIRIAMGLPGAHPINERTGEMLEWASEAEGDIDFGITWAQLTWPGLPEDPITETKYMHAQFGAEDNPLGYGDTPPRPIVAVDETDLAELLLRLSSFITLQIIAGSK